MIKMFFTTLFRQLWINRLFTILNVLGLSVCICVAWIVFRMVDYEYSFDKKIPDVENVYQLVNKSKNEGERESGFSGVPKPVLAALLNNVTGADLVVPMFYKSYNSVTVADKYKAPKSIAGEESIEVVATLSDYFDLLPYQWLVGNKEKALDNPDAIVLTEERAKLYFPYLNPSQVIGERIVYDDTIIRQVTGVIKNLNYPNSFSANNKEFVKVSSEEMSDENWGGASSRDLIFFKPDKNVAPATVLNQLNVINEKFNKKQFERYKYTSWFDVLPMTKKHFATEYGQQTRAANKKVLMGLMIVGGFLLLLACVNYVNLSTALMPKRAKEIGIRKTLGSSTKNLVWRFIGETFVVTSMAVVFSFGLTFFGVKLFADFLPSGIFDYMNYPGMIGFMLLLVIVISLLSGIYPAWLSTKVDTVSVLKGVTDKVIGRNKFTLRKGLIVFQFFVAQVFIVGAVIMSQQLRYVLQTDLGFNKDAVITFEVPDKVLQDNANKDKHFVLKEELRRNTKIKNIALGSRPMDNTMWGNVYSYYKDTIEVQSQVNLKFVDDAFLSLYDFRLLAGRNLRQTDTINEMLINEKAAIAYGFSSPQEAIGKTLVSPGSKKSYPIVGVIKDFHQFGLQSKIDPVVLVSSKKQLTIFNIKLTQDASKWSGVINEIEKEWNTVYAGVPFKFKFYDEFVGEFYESEKRTQTLVKSATAIAIFISCLGLFGLATLTSFQRRKEIGVRKVLGASVTGIVGMLSREFVILVLASIVIATPLAWWLMNEWLKDFAYRVSIEWWMFIISGIAAIVIALLTVSYQAIRAAIANPIKSLRTE